MSEAGIVAAVIGGLFMILAALITVWRFRRKDSAESESLEDGTISGRFKDAASLMEFIDAAVEKKVEPIRRELDESHDAIEAFRAWVVQIWFWDRRGRRGAMPMVSDEMLHKLGLTNLALTPTADIGEDTEPII